MTTSPQPAPRSLLIIRGGALGDTLLTIPALRAIRRAWPTAHITYVGNATVIRQIAPEVADRVESIDGSVALPLFGAPPPTDHPFAGIDVAITWLSDRAGAVSVALEQVGVGRVQAWPPIPDQPGRHVADHLLASLESLGIPVPDDWDHAAWLAPPAIGSSVDPGSHASDLAFVHPGSGSPSKNWPAGQFAGLIDALGRRALRPLVLAGPADDDAVARLRALRPGVAIARPASVADLAALVARGRLFVGNDSGTAHLAAGLGVPTVAIFGPTDPARWAPRGPNARVVAPSTPGPMVEQAPSLELVLGAVGAALDDTLPDPSRGGQTSAGASR